MYLLPTVGVSTIRSRKSEHFPEYQRDSYKYPSTRVRKIDFATVRRKLVTMALNRFVLVGVLVACMAFGAFADDDEEKYPDKYDHLNVEDVLYNDRLRNQYLKCFLDTGPCSTPEAIFFKDYIPEAIVTKCRKCTERQKDAFEKIAVWYAENRPDEWETIIRKAVDDFTKKGVARKAAEKAAGKAA